MDESRVRDAGRLRRAGDGFRAVVSKIGDDQWALDTPCDGWSVRDLVGHVAAGSRMVVALADGGTRNDAIAVLGIDHLGDDPRGALAAALERQAEVFERPGIDEQIFEHPAGDMPGAQVLSFRIGDLVAHQWDLATAIGVDDTLDPDLVERAWSDIEPMLPVLGSLGVFGAGPSGVVAGDAPLQVRLLDAMGRRP